MRKDDPQINLRIPPDLKERIQQAAKKNRRTQTAEIVARLQESFELSLSSPDKVEDELEKVVGEFGKMLEDLKNNFDIKRKDDK
ncbi:Arc family DNA-binding protein [Halomonas sp.]|uniref:Arc family DNA-binding protein n=1 Tax=unclassified Halomonas TaxID=2609666 RepID=UPI003F916DB9